MVDERGSIYLLRKNRSDLNRATKVGLLPRKLSRVVRVVGVVKTFLFEVESLVLGSTALPPKSVPRILSMSLRRTTVTGLASSASEEVLTWKRL